MEQLRFTAVHEDGQHLVLSTADGTELLLPVDARLRSALRSRSAPADAPATPLSPRNVQAMIRAGQSPEEVAEITGWPAERVARFEGPILAEREHISGMAQAAHVRGRAPEGGVPTLGSRVLDRLAERGVDTDNVGWDATRPEGGVWTVVVSFVAGQRQRGAAWRFDPQDRTVEALDDEARWLSEDEQALPGIAAGPSRGRAPAKPLLSSRTSAGEVELMTSMRERSRSRGRRKKASTSSSDPAGLPQLEHAPEDVLPLEDLAYDPDTMGLPPAAHGESPAPDAATGPTPAQEEPAEPTPTQDVQSNDGGAASSKSAASKRASAGKGGAAAGRDDGQTAYDVPLQFDNDDDAAALEPDRSPQHATLDDLFGPEDEDDESDNGESDNAESDNDESDVDDSDDDTRDGDESDGTASDDVELDEDDVAMELGEEALAEDAAELGGDLEGTDETDAPDDVDTPATAADIEQAASPDGPADAVSTADTSVDDDTDEVESEESIAAADDPEPANDTEPATDLEPEPTDTTAEDTTEGKPESQDTTEKPAAKPKRRKDGRPGVPSWDDIMFGAKDRK